MASRTGRQTRGLPLEVLFFEKTIRIAVKDDL